MLIETDNLVSAEEFRKHLDKYIAAAREGLGPLAVTQGAEVVGFFIGREEYETLFGAAVKNLLASRAKGRTVSHEEAKKRIRATIERAATKL